MKTDPADLRRSQGSSGSPMTSRSILVHAAMFGLVGGYLDLGMIHLKRDVLRLMLYHEQGRNFLWGVPTSYLGVVMILGLVVVAVNRVLPGRVTPRAAAWLFATLAFWGPLLRAPFFGLASLMLAAGSGRVAGHWFANRLNRKPRSAAVASTVLAALVLTTAAASISRQRAAERDAEGRLPGPPAGSPNVLLIVMDTVRAESLSLYQYSRDTTPNLARWAKRGARFDWASAAAPWTFPSHCSILTGQWPSTLDAHWRPEIDPGYPTLAEYLAAKGYMTAGFVSNTYWCSYESRMDRGFVHYEDYPLDPRTILASTVPGRWIVEHTLSPWNYYEVKWVRSQSRDAGGINRAFLGWLAGRREPKRPFFAFLNYLDAHEPFVPPGDAGKGFGRRPRTRGEYRTLLDYWDREKLKLAEPDVTLARDSYDDCIAGLDRQIGVLLDDLDGQGVLDETVVVITSDHGESFGEHGVFNHGFSLFAPEVHVPLVILSSKATGGRAVADPVSLRDLAATVVEQAGVGYGSPFPGSSLGEFWRPGRAVGAASTSPARAEVDVPAVTDPRRGPGSGRRGFLMSLVSGNRHYLVGAAGGEELYDLSADPEEMSNVVQAPGEKDALSAARAMLLRALAGDPVAKGVAGTYLARVKGVLGGLSGR